MPVGNKEYKTRVSTAADAVRKIRRGGTIFIGSGGASPQTLIQGLIEAADHFSDNEIIHLLTLGKADYVSEKYKDSFRHNAFFIGSNVRGAVNRGDADYTPIFLSEIPALFRKGGITIDAALIMVSPPDKYGFCCLGINVDIVKEAAEQAKFLIAEINPNMPVTHGDSFIHISSIDCFIETDTPLLEHRLPRPDEVSETIAGFIAQLIDDGSTLQMGIGTIPDAVLKHIKDKVDLGIHTEMFSDGIIELIEAGAVTNRKKGFHNGKITTSFCLGTKKLYDYVDRNPGIEFHPSDFINNPIYIARNKKMVSINSALEVDLTGQVCADSIGHLFYSGIGGQVDFIRGAAFSEGGKPVIALPSTAKGGKVSRIVPHLNRGAGVVTTRGDVHYVVTEYGIAYLHGKSVRQRAIELTQIAHPDFRGELLDSLKERHYVFFDQESMDKLTSFAPGEFEFSMALSGGRDVAFRPVHPADERMVQDFFYSHTIDTIYNRYFYVENRMHHGRAQSLVNINFNRDMAIVGLYGPHEGQIVMAIGRYHLNPTKNSAEVAFVVHEEFQGQGVGTRLLNHLIEIGRDRGIQEFYAHVLSSNVRMMKIFEKVVPEFKKRIEDGIIEISFRLKDVPATFCFLRK